jgi:glutamyl endopeptidase
MRISLEVDDGQKVTSITEGVGPASRTTAATPGTPPTGYDGHTSLSNADAHGGGSRIEAEESPEAGDGTPAAADAVGDVEAVGGYELPDTEREAEIANTVDEHLRDIGEASFGTPHEAALEAIIGDDDRVQITATNVYPWRVHCSLRITAADGSPWIGTGWFCGPHTVITAGHCVYITNSGVPGRDGWVRDITVIPGRNGATQPFGSVVSTNFRTVTGWAYDKNHEYDYGAIILPENLGDSTGWLGFGAYSDATLTSSTANISGYPGDQPAGTQWYHARRISSVGERKVYYDVDTFGGQSGSAVYRIHNGARYAVGVHAYGGATSNSGTRITSGVFNNFVTWKA